MLSPTYRALEILRALLEPSKLYYLLSPVELVKKLTGFGPG